MRDAAVHFGFFFNDTATTEIYTLSLHDALPISVIVCLHPAYEPVLDEAVVAASELVEPLLGLPQAEEPDIHFSSGSTGRSEEHTSELQSRQYLVCRLLLEKKKQYRLNCAITVTI